MGLVAFILMVVCLIVSYRLISIRKKILSIEQQLNNQTFDFPQLITIDLNDAAINSLVQSINKKILADSNNKTALLQAEQELKETISNVSHDLRTPLTAIIGYTQLLEKSNLTAEQFEYVHTIIDKNLYLKKLIHSFFELSYYESKNADVSLDEINASAVLLEVILNETAAFEEKGIRLELDIPENIYLIADEKLFTRIIQNLLTNVLIHGQHLLKIQISQDEETMLTIGNKFDSRVVLEPTKLFDRFYVGKNERNSNGNGLGLAIVKLLTEKNNGTADARVTNDFFEIRLHFPHKFNSEKEATQ
ncbi:sensor histidine kinase [Enterococcus sp. DIV0756]|uniref:sensor histidine kinase n=1 Tax=Enterococcus sp. DIV0756 TaxID=2774636 RepID=UPI003F276A4B